MRGYGCDKSISCMSSGITVHLLERFLLRISLSKSKLEGITEENIECDAVLELV